MGKKIIITGANFSTNGIKENHIDFEVSTSQGIIMVAGSSEGKLGPNDSTYHNKYVHSSGSVIKLYPNDTIAVLTVPNQNLRACMISYHSVTSVYPDNIVNTTYQTIGSYYKRTANTGPTSLPIKLLNDTDHVLYLVIEYSVESGRISPTAYPTIAYRIYTDNPENYEADPEAEGIDSGQAE